MKRPIGLILTTVVLGLIALTQILSSIVMAVTGLLGSHAQPPAPRADIPIPPHAVGSIVLVFSLILALILALLAGWAIFTIVGLLRLRNWGRISVLIIGGCLAVLGGISTLGFIFLLFAQSFLKSSSATPPPYSPQLMAFILGFTAFFYAIIAAIGIWWLVYFSRPAIKALFIRPAIDPYAQPTYIDPAYPPPPPATPGRFAHVPAAIVIVACFFLLSTLTCALMAFVPLPAFLCGFIITGPAKYILYLSFAAICGYIGYGLLHLDDRARLATLAFLGFSFVNMGCLFLPWGRAQYTLYNQQIMQKFQIAGIPASPMPDLSYIYMIFVAIFVVLFNGFIFWLLQRHRNAFHQPPTSS